MFMLWDVEAEVELLNAASGGWRRPFALWLDSRSSFTVVLVKEYQVQVLVRTEPAASHTAEDVLHDDNMTDTQAYNEYDGGLLQQKGVDYGTGIAASSTIDGRTLVLMPPHHGKIVHACVCLQLSMHLVAVVTTSEDGCVRVVSYRYSAHNIAQNSNTPCVLGAYRNSA